MKHIKAHKKLYIVLALLLALLAAVYFLFLRTYLRRHFHTVTVDRTALLQGEKVPLQGKKGIVVYFTRVGNTAFDPDVDATSGASLMVENGALIGNAQLLAEMIARTADLPLYPIATVKKYPSSYNDTVEEARREMRDEGKVELAGELPDLSPYDTVFLVYPLWWGTLPEAVKVFLNDADLAGKTVYTLVTHGGSGFGTALQDSRPLTDAAVSDNALAVYDDDTLDALPRVTDWLKSIA